MQSPETPPVLADAADVLSDQLRVHLTRLSKLLKPHAAELDRHFCRRIRARHYDRKQLKALSEITPGAAGRIIAARQPLSNFFEQVEYSGRRLAKLNVPPADIIQALREYDQVLDPLLSQQFPDEYENFRWAREQLHFCVVLTLNNAFYQVREAETQAFYDLFRAELQAKCLEELLELFLQTLKRTCNAKVGLLRLLNDEIGPARLKKLSIPRYIQAGGRDEQLILEPGWRGRFKSYWSIPLTSKGRVGGLIQFGFPTQYHWLPRELQLLDAAAERCLLAAEKARLIEDLAAREEQVRQLAEHMLQVEEEERRRICRELHDEAGQSMLLIRLQLEMIEKSLPPDLKEIRGKLSETRDVTEHTIVEIRRVIAALSPAVLEQLGLPAALRQLVIRFRRVYPGRVRLHLPSRLGLVSREAAIILYRLVQECCHNIAKHSAAANVNISLRSTDQILELSVEDDGAGFDVETALEKRNSFGLAGMMERVALLGGTFKVQSKPGQGTSIYIELPINSKKVPLLQEAAIGWGHQILVPRSRNGRVTQ